MIKRQTIEDLEVGDIVKVSRGGDLTFKAIKFGYPGGLEGYIRSSVVLELQFNPESFWRSKNTQMFLLLMIMISNKERMFDQLVLSKSQFEYIFNLDERLIEQHNREYEEYHKRYD